jgi:ankyrin repeat protein
MRDIDEELLNACWIGDLEKVKQLLAKGAHVDAKDNLGGTALMLAAFMGHKEVVKLLKSYGA